jgi:hypothetical protein
MPIELIGLKRNRNRLAVAEMIGGMTRPQSQPRGGLRLSGAKLALISIKAADDCHPISCHR